MVILYCLQATPIEVVDQNTWDKERARQATICHHNNELCRELDILRSHYHAERYSANAQGVREEWNKLREMPRNKISDIQQQAELLNILDNRCHQFQEAYMLIKNSNISHGYTISYGDTAVLRGSWEDAIEAVCLSTKHVDNVRVDTAYKDTEPEFLNTETLTGSNVLDYSDNEKLSPFDPLPLSGIAKMFPLKQDEKLSHDSWRSYAGKASRNGFKECKSVSWQRQR